MAEWQPIESAPRDGTRILVTDGKVFAVAVAWDYTEPDTIGWNGRVGDKQFQASTERPNPCAGQIHRYWACEGLTAWERDTVSVDYDHAIVYGDDGEKRLFDRATHWMPLFALPK